MKDLGELKFSLGIEFARSKKGIVMSQRKYALELVAEMGLSGTKPFIKPLETNLKLTSLDYDSIINNTSADNDDKLLTDPGKYQRRLVTCYLVKFGNAIVSWKSKKQETVARSSAEAEFRSIASM
uniref:Reverse transcriptase Ty1/copia-type domain-containing protein n=1 Tax=Solanum lycopersicum TaxID=4081 RepID=A0A3Q7JBU3_SOLLC